MKLSILIPTSALVVAMGLAMPVAAHAQQPGPAQKAIQRALGRHPKVLKELKALTPASRPCVLHELHGLILPQLVLVDEWVAYARQLHDQSDLPGGGFETQFSFAQALTESEGDLKLVRRIAENGRWRVEANDMGAVRLLAGRPAFFRADAPRQPLLPEHEASVRAATERAMAAGAH